MAEQDTLSDAVGFAATIGDSGVGAPPSGGQGVLQEGCLSLSPTDSTGDGVVQPYPRSPKLQRRLAESGKLSEKELSRRLEELQEERTRAKAHIQSLKKRRADLSRSTETKKQKVAESFEVMRATLAREERNVLDSLERDRRETSARLDEVLKGWGQHLAQVQRGVAATQNALGPQGGGEGDAQDPSAENVSCHKKPAASETEIRLDEDRFERLLRTLRSVSNHLKAQLLRKTLLLDSSPVVIDRQTCHGQITVAEDGRSLFFSNPPASAPERPLQFDKVCCALGSAPLATGRSYWEADVGCCSAWAVGVAYGCLERKGRDRGAKLGRNRNSWCVELRDGRLAAWHNERSVACQAGGRGAPPGAVGVWVDYAKGRLAFYDADTMRVLQEFSAAMTAVFDRAHHQFTEPLYPALRFLRPAEGHACPPSHLQVRDLNAP